ncbi:hypothetical protein L599_001500000670 [Luteimonas sp. J16]|nr:hypothetical protein L599_001500000670 [Luteimonas sp. J16]
MPAITTRPPDRGLPCDRRLHTGPAAGGTARGRSVVARTWRRGGPPATRARRRDCPVEPRTVVPNSLPMPAVSAIASVPQKVMRNVALSPLAPLRRRDRAGQRQERERRDRHADHLHVGRQKQHRRQRHRGAHDERRGRSHRRLDGPRLRHLVDAGLVAGMRARRIILRRRPPRSPDKAAGRIRDRATIGFASSPGCAALTRATQLPRSPDKAAGRIRDHPQLADDMSPAAAAHDRWGQRVPTSRPWPYCAPASGSGPSATSTAPRVLLLPNTTQIALSARRIT